MKTSLFIVLLLALCGCGDDPDRPKTGSVERSEPGPEDLRLAAMAQTWKGLTVTDRVEAIIRLARSGDAAAQFALGNLYKDGKGGVPRDYAKAYDSFLAAAGQGHTGAQFNLGAMHGNGIGVPRDDAKAMEWIRKAADGGHPMAREWLAREMLAGRKAENSTSKGGEGATKGGEGDG